MKTFQLEVFHLDNNAPDMNEDDIVDVLYDKFGTSHDFVISEVWE